MPSKSARSRRRIIVEEVPFSSDIFVTKESPPPPEVIVTAAPRNTDFSRNRYQLVRDVIEDGRSLLPIHPQADRYGFEVYNQDLTELNLDAAERVIPLKFDFKWIHSFLGDQASIFKERVMIPVRNRTQMEFHVKFFRSNDAMTGRNGYSTKVTKSFDHSEKWIQMEDPKPLISGYAYAAIFINAFTVERSHISWHDHLLDIEERIHLLLNFNSFMKQGVKNPVNSK